MALRQGQLPIFIIILLALVFSSFKAIGVQNYEFVLYIGVIVFFFVLIYFTNEKTKLSNGVLWGLAVWALLHLSGGLLVVNGSVLYKFVLINIFENSNFIILRFDQFVHFFGFFIATFLCYDLIKPHLGGELTLKISFLIFLMSVGLGSINEVIEFMAVLIMPETGVGGYYNTLWDLVFNSLGSLLAILWINFHKSLA